MKKKKLLVGALLATAIFGLAACTKDNGSKTPASSTPAQSTPASTTPSTPAPSTPVSTPAPSTPAPSTPAPSTPAPSTPSNVGQKIKLTIKNVDPFDATKNDSMELTIENDGYAYADDLVDPTNDYKTFAGWYLDEACTQEALLDNGFQEDTIIYAKWDSKFEQVVSGFAAAQDGSVVSWANVTAAAGSGNQVTINGEFTFGAFTFANGVRLEADNNAVNTQGKTDSIKVVLSGVTNSISISSGVWASSTAGKVRIYKESSDTTPIYESGTYANKDVIEAINVTDLEAGTYIIYPEKSLRIYDLIVTEEKELSPETGFELVSAGNVDFVAGGLESYDYSNIQLSAKFANGKKESLDVADVSVDTSKINTAVAGSYPVTITYKDYEPVTYNVNIYEIESIALGDYTLSSKRATQNLQKVFLVNDTINNDNLSVIATAKCGELTKNFVLTDNLYSITNPTDLSTAGKQTVTVVANGKEATYDINVVENIFDANAVEYNINVDANAESVVVNTENGATFNSVVDALKYLKIVGAKAEAEKNINIAAGEYFEKIEIDMPNVNLVGLGTTADDVILVYDALNGLTDPSGKTLHSTDGSASVSVRAAATGFSATNLTFRNYYNTHELYQEAVALTSGSTSQSVALYCEADQSIFKNCNFTSYHDTLYANKGRQYYENCFIEGRTDYIFGDNATAYFKDCTISTIGAGLDNKNGGYVACTKGSGVQYGYIFDGCTFTADENVMPGSVSLGRTWDAGMACIIMNSEISAAYSLADFGTDNGGVNTRYTEMNKGKSPNPATILEFNNIGDGAITESLANSVTVVTEDVAAPYANLNTIFAATNGTVTYDANWAGPAVKDADVILKNVDESTLLTLTDVGYVGSAITKDELVAAVTDLIPAGHVLDGFYNDAACTDAYDEATDVLSAETVIYVKFASAGVIAAATASADDLASETIANGSQVAWGNFVTLVSSESKAWSYEAASGKSFVNVNGETVTTTGRIKSNGSAQTFVIDLSSYGGTALVELHFAPGGSSERSYTLTQDNTGAVISTESFTASSQIARSFELECGTTYTFSNSNGFNFYGINVYGVTEETLNGAAKYVELGLEKTQNLGEATQFGSFILSPGVRIKSDCFSGNKTVSSIANDNAYITFSSVKNAVLDLSVNNDNRPLYIYKSVVTTDPTTSEEVETQELVTTLFATAGNGKTATVELDDFTQYYICFTELDSTAAEQVETKLIEMKLTQYA